MSDSASPRLSRSRIGERSVDEIPVMATGRSTPVEKVPLRPRWRLRIFLALNAFVVGLFLFSQLDPSTVKELGPVGQYVFGLLHPPIEPEISALGPRLRAEIRALGGEAHVMERHHRFLGLFGRTELFDIRVNRTEFGDLALAGLVKTYGDCIWGLDLRNTHVTDQGP